MSNAAEVQIRALERFASQVLEPAIHEDSVPLRVQAHVTRRALPIEEARGHVTREVKCGWRWGPVWATCWFRLTGNVPDRFAGDEICLRFSSGTEALLWQEGVPVRGFDRNRDSLRLFGAGPIRKAAAGGEQVEFWIEAACNHPFGISTFEWDDEEVHQRWKSDEPGRLERAELTRFRPKVLELENTFRFACGLVRELEEGAPRRTSLVSALERARDLVRPDAVAESAATALEPLSSALAAPSPGTATICHAVGHAHIDTAWLWTIGETRRKCQRSFSNALELIDASEDFKFVCSQAVQWSFVAQDAPALFERMKAAALEGRFQAEGGMWVEPDANIPSGEALVRQILHARRFWEEHLGELGHSRCLYLPDTFGFTASLPQIMAQSGLELFVTNKLNWNATNEFPHTSFVWEGIDGSEVLAHLTPGGDYNATNTPRELVKGARAFRSIPHVAPGRWLQPFGYGDGGGGPTEGQVENVRLAKDCEGLPRVQLDSLSGFADALAEDRADAQSRGSDFPRWRGELYLELHRGVLTTNGRLKRANRRAERDLVAAELFIYGGPDKVPDPESLAERLDVAWKALLTNQFHDILPGTSIREVHAEAESDHAELRGTLDDLLERGVRSWFPVVDTIGLEEPWIVFNPSSSERSGSVLLPDGKRLHAHEVPAFGALAVDGLAANAEEGEQASARAEGLQLSNGLLEAELDEAGRLARLVHLPSGREVGALERGTGGSLLKRAALNQLVLYEDRPHAWDAWDIDPGYESSARPITDAAESVRVVDRGPERASIEVSRSLGRGSRIVQTYVLEAGSPRLDVETFVDWCEEHTLLRALFPVDVVAERATYDVQFGVVERPTHANTSWDAARFEVCAHEFADLSERGFGVALLNDSKYGHSCREGVLGLSLLRSPTHPDPIVDRGEHRFTYSVMPHSGDWREAGVSSEAEALNAPLRAVQATPGKAAAVRPGAGRSWTPFEFEVPQKSACQPRFDAFKPAEEGNALILRLHEHAGGRGEVIVHWNLKVRAAESVDLVERPRPRDGFAHVGQTTRVPLGPFEIVTLRVELDR